MLRKLLGWLLKHHYKITALEKLKRDYSTLSYAYMSSIVCSHKWKMAVIWEQQLSYGQRIAIARISGSLGIETYYRALRWPSWRKAINQTLSEEQVWVRIVITKFVCYGQSWARWWPKGVCRQLRGSEYQSHAWQWDKHWKHCIEEWQTPTAPANRENTGLCS